MASIRPLLLSTLPILICFAAASQSRAHDARHAAQHRHEASVDDPVSSLLQRSEEFLRENEAAMAKMMGAMHTSPSGDIDRDFVEMMVPHHQGAIDMAKAVLRHSHNDQIRRLAQEIIVTQQQEIAAMRRAIGDPLPASYASPTQIAPRQ